MSGNEKTIDTRDNCRDRIIMAALKWRLGKMEDDEFSRKVYEQVDEAFMEGMNEGMR